ncbi:MAG: hypothetical protein LBT71_05810 [Azoarcus sp.]|nr:hypothetical protein [Azoarcus sp.]
MKPTVKASLIAAAIALLPLGAQAAGLGQVAVQSRLGEPLNAEIPINATPQELQSLTAHIAPPEAFLQANVPYAGFVPGIRVAIENRGGRSVLRLTSSAPINEAVASLMIQLNWDDGRLTRTINFLLDPADLAIRSPGLVTPPVEQPAPVVSALSPDPESQFASSTPAPDLEPFSVPAPEVAPAPAPVPEFVAPQPRPLAQPETTPAPVRAPAPPLRAALEGDYAVKYGDTLGSIARSRMPEDVTLEQMMVALHRANASAFIDGNVNRLKTGAILKVPLADEARVISTIEARQEVRVQARDFNAWRERLASEVASRPATPTDEGAGRTRSIDTVPPVAEQNSDRVAISSGTGTGTGQGDATRLRQLEENIAATQNSLKDAKERVSELETINQKLEALLALRNQELAKLQTQLSQAAQQAAAPASPVVAMATPAPAPEPPVVVAEPTPAPTPVAELAPEPVAVETEPVAAVPEPIAAVPEPVATADEAPAVDEDPLLELITDPQTLGIGALIIALLGGFLGFRSWQRKRSESGLDTLSQDTSMFPSEATSIFGDNGGQSVDTSASSIIHTDFSQTGLSIDTNEGVDPVAEADVYMAYGRDTQAEEILNDALKADPKRGAIYVKLLEIYAQRQDLPQFETTATELYSRTQGQGRDWEKAVQMGRKLDPANPLYNGAASAGSDEETALPVPGWGPGNLDLTAADSAGPTLSGLDFGAAPTAVPPATNPGQLKETVAAKGRVEDLLATRVISDDVNFGISSATPASSPMTTAGQVDFDLNASKTASSTNTSIDFDFDKPVARPAAEKKQPARQPAGIVSRRPVARQPSIAATANATGGMAVPLEFGLPDNVLGNGNGVDMSATVVLPSVKGGNERGDATTLDLEKTSFDPHALDFDLDLDAGVDGAAVASAPRTRSRAAAPVEEPGDVGEIDTKLELARAYEDMGDTEGALELLREVVAEGGATQKAAARALIEKLS